MDIILNYIFIGFIFTFFIDWLLSLNSVRNHPNVKDLSWGNTERIICIIIWPLSALIFLIAFIKPLFRK